MLMSDDDTKRKFAVQLYCKLEESLVTLEFSTDRVTVDGVTRFDPDSEYPMNYGDGPIPLTAGSDKIHWTGVMSESYWTPADQWNLSKNQWTLIFLALQAVSHCCSALYLVDV